MKHCVFIQTNLVGTYNLLEAARGRWEEAGRPDGFRFLHVSTDEVYGSLGAEGFFTEETPYDPSSPYSASKAAADHLVRAWGETYGLEVVTSNCSNNCGPWQFPEKLIPLCLTNILRGRPLPVYGSGRNIRRSATTDRPSLASARRGRHGEPGGMMLSPSMQKNGRPSTAPRAWSTA